jgi:nucleoside-diphosphate-sugar epimerase
MKILITGNMGYVGPGVVSQLRFAFPDATLVGFDTSYFATCLTNAPILPESKLNAQIFGDVRSMPHEVLDDVDVVIHLAAISNDPMGSRYEEVTMDVNYQSSIRIAEMAKSRGVKSFIFASSCSMYGLSDGSSKSESATLNPLTAYARSKVYTEQSLEDLADANFTVTALRFATACGMSDRLRLDLVLNDFVAGAVTSGKINILSDGSPWRPLIHVKDMALAIEWAVTRSAGEDQGHFLAINAGSNAWNFQVSELAEAVASLIPGCTVILNKNAAPDLRSYKVSFDRFEALAPNHQPQYTLKQTILELYNGLIAMNFETYDFRNSLLMRLKVLQSLQDNHYINHNLHWYDKIAKAKNSSIEEADNIFKTRLN